MAIHNTVKLTEDDIDTMNSGIRPFTVPTGEKDALAKFYGVGVRTVERWFALEGQQYRRCVPVRDSAITGNPGALDRRVYQMFDAINPTGVGNGAPIKMEDGTLVPQPLQNMRLRCFLAASLGVDGGLEREPIYQGEHRVLIEGQGSLAACVARINTIYTGNATYFLWKAWVSFQIQPTTEGANNWNLIITYAPLDYGDASDAEEVEVSDSE